ncbi:MAG: tetratricopeptide repeat protein, partial [Candidatus Hodarchaeota archaeon]
QKFLLLKSKLMNKWGRYEEGLRLAKQLLKETNKPRVPFQKIDVIIIMTEALLHRSKFDKCLQEIEQGEEILRNLEQGYSADLVKRKVRLISLRGTICRLKGEMDQSLAYFQQSLTLSKKIGNKRGIAESFHNMGNIYYLKTKLTESLEYYQQALLLREQINDKQGLAETLANIGLNYLERENFNQAMNYFQRALTLRKQIGNKIDIAKSIDNIAGFYFRKGQYNQALSNYQQSYNLRKSYGNKYYTAISLNNIGAVKQQKGMLDEALRHYTQSIELYRQANHKNGLAIVLRNIGRIYNLKGQLNPALECFRESLELLLDLGNKKLIGTRLIDIGKLYGQKGEPDVALRYYRRSLNVFKELDYKSGIASSLYRIAGVYWQKGKPEKALKIANQSLRIREELGNNFFTAEVLYTLIHVTISNNLLEKAREYMQRLQKINLQEDIKSIDQRCRMAEALLLRKSNRIRDWGRAETLFEEIAKEEIVDYELTIQAMLNLCGLFLFGLRTSNDPRILEEIQAIVTKLLNITKEQHSHSLLVEVYILKAKVALLELNIHTARRFLTQAQLTAEEKGLDRLAIKASHEHDSLLNQLNQWQALTSQQAPMSERLELTQLEKTLNYMERKETLGVLEVRDEEPVLLSIFSSNKSILFSKKFNADQTINARLIGYFLSSMNVFSTEIFAHPIERIKINDYKMIIHNEPPLLWCYLFKGQSYLAQQKFTKFIRKVSCITPLWQTLTQSTQLGHFLSQQEETTLEDLSVNAFKKKNTDKSNLNQQLTQYKAKRQLLNHWCRNKECPEYSKKFRGNISIKDRKGKAQRPLLQCKICGLTFSETRGSMFFGSHTPHVRILRVLTLLSEERSIRAVARKTGHARKTISNWLKKAIDHTDEITDYFLNDLDLTQNQVDKIWIGLKKLEKKQFQ